MRAKDEKKDFKFFFSPSTQGGDSQSRRRKETRGFRRQAGPDCQTGQGPESQQFFGGPNVRRSPERRDSGDLFRVSVRFLVDPVPSDRVYAAEPGGGAMIQNRGWIVLDALR